MKFKNRISGYYFSVVGIIGENSDFENIPDDYTDVDLSIKKAYKLHRHSDGRKFWIYSGQNGLLQKRFVQVIFQKK